MKHKNILIMLSFIAAGVALPFLSGMVHIEQHILLMQAVVIVCGFFLPLNMAIVCAAIIPFLCWLLLQFPTFFPALPVTVCQMVAIVSFINMMHFALGLSPFKSLLISILLGWLVLFSAASILSWLVADFSAVSYSFGIIAEGWPGLIAQLLLIPLFVTHWEKRHAIRVDT